MPRASWCLLAFNLKSAILEDFTDISSWPDSSSSEDVFPLLLLLLLFVDDKLSGKTDRGSVKDDELELLRGIRGGGGAGDAWGRPNRVLTRSELLKPDKKGLKPLPKAATTAAY